MKTILAFFPLLALPGLTAAQEADCLCRNDLAFVYDEMQKLPSYKDQIEGQAASEYRTLYEELQNAVDCRETTAECFSLISRLFIPIRDKHAGVRGVTKRFTQTDLTDSAIVADYRRSEIFLENPRVAVDLDSLHQALSNRGTEEVEGIYYYRDLIVLGLFRTAKPDSLLGVVLRSEFPLWEPGQVVFQLTEYAPNQFHSIHPGLLRRNLLFFKNETYENQRLIETPWKKFPDRIDYHLIEEGAETFSFRTIEEGIDYLRLGDFSINRENRAKADQFYAQIKGQLKSKHLIVDLRNNSGGGNKTSKQFLKLLRSYARKGNVYLLLNRGCNSNCEIFTLTLQRSKKVQALGLPTQGALSYGTNYGRRLPSPSGRFEFVITDMDFSQYLPYEEVGIEPDIRLDYNRDWIEQALEIINGKND